MSFDQQAGLFEARAGIPEAACRRIAASVLDLADLGADDLLVEIGPGTGQIGAELARRAPRYLGLDASERMLAVFRERLGAAPPHAELVLGDAAARWPVADASARCVFGSRSLHLLPTRHVAGEARRVACARSAVLLVGRVERERTALRETLRRKLRELLGASAGRSGRAHVDELIAECVRHGAESLPARPVADWQAQQSAAEVLASWADNPNLGKAGLSTEEQHDVLARLRSWAETELGPLERVHHSIERYLLAGARV